MRRREGVVEGGGTEVGARMALRPARRAERREPVSAGVVGWGGGHRPPLVA